MKTSEKNYIRGIMWKRHLLKQCKTVIYEEHFKLTLTYNAET